MHSLYDKVNDVVDDIEYTKTIELNSNVLNNNIEKSISKINKTIDEVSINRLDEIKQVLAFIFCILLILFVLFILFVTNF